MFDCRYYDLCCFTDDSCNGEQECPKRDHCQFYSPMPDVKALLALAREMEHSVAYPESCPVLAFGAAALVATYARRICEACGEVA